MHGSIDLSDYLSICRSVYLYLRIYLSIDLSSVLIPIHLAVYLCVYLSFPLSSSMEVRSRTVRSSVCLSVCMCLRQATILRIELIPIEATLVSSMSFTKHADTSMNPAASIDDMQNGLNVSDAGFKQTAHAATPRPPPHKKNT